LDPLCHQQPADPCLEQKSIAIQAFVEEHWVINPNSHLNTTIPCMHNFQFRPRQQRFASI
jgi:hypothetical protein